MGVGGTGVGVGGTGVAVGGTGVGVGGTGVAVGSGEEHATNAMLAITTIKTPANMIRGDTTKEFILLLSRSFMFDGSTCEQMLPQSSERIHSGASAIRRTASG